VVTRYGARAARTAAMLIYTLRGAPLLYYGEEIGMENADLPAEGWLDPYGRLLGLCRDPQRTPMQWDDTANAGFSPASVERTWLPVHPNFISVNVAAQQREPSSLLALYAALGKLRRERDTLMAGNYIPVSAGLPAHVYAFMRQLGGKRDLVILNFLDQFTTVNLSRHDLSRLAPTARTLLSTQLDRSGPEPLGFITLRPHEGLVMEMDEMH